MKLNENIKQIEFQIQKTIYHNYQTDGWMNVRKSQWLYPGLNSSLSLSFLQFTNFFAVRSIVIHVPANAFVQFVLGVS